MLLRPENGRLCYYQSTSARVGQHKRGDPELCDVKFLCLCHEIHELHCPLLSWFCKLHLLLRQRELYLATDWNSESELSKLFWKRKRRHPLQKADRRGMQRCSLAWGGLLRALLGILIIEPNLLFRCQSPVLSPSPLIRRNFHG